MNYHYDPNNPYGYDPIDPRQMMPRQNKWAFASLILGVLSMLCFGVLPSILAIVFAVLDRKQNGSFTKMSLVGLILGIVATVISVPLLIYNLYILATAGPEALMMVTTML